MQIKEMLKMYPWIDQEIKKLNKKLNEYLEMQEETRNSLKAQTLDDMPKVFKISDQTYKAVESIIDLYDSEINRLIERIRHYWDIKKKLEQGFSFLTVDEMQIIELSYNNRMSYRKIGYKLHMSYESVRRFKSEVENKINNILNL